MHFRIAGHGIRCMMRQEAFPAISEVKFSLVSNRGCFGGCNFCALTMHQGRIVQTRSHASILAEARQMTEDPEFKGYIHDVGGPMANFRHPSCEKQLTKGVCQNRAVPVSEAVSESERRPQGLCGTAAQPEEAAKSEEGIHPFQASGLIICWPIRQMFFFVSL